MKKTIWTLVVLASLGLLAPAVHATSFTLDDFTQPNTGQTMSVTGVGTAFNTTTGLAGVVGGVRAMQLTVIASTYGQRSSLLVSPIPPGTLSLSNDSGQNGVGKITWDANSAGLGGVDLTNGGTLPYLQSKILASDLDLGFRVDITETAAEGGSTAFWSTNLGPGVSYVNELLANFTNSANVNFAKVDRIVLTMSGPFAQDATLDFLEVDSTDRLLITPVIASVPEPGTCLVVFFGLVSLCAYLKKSRFSGSTAA